MNPYATFCVATVLSVVCVTPVAANRTCRNVDNSAGQCVHLSDCPSLGGLFNTNPPQIANEHLRIAKQSCGTKISSREQDQDPDVMVCCGFVVNPNNPFLPKSTPYSRRDQEDPERRVPSRLRKPTTSEGVMIEQDIGNRSIDTCVGPDRKIGVCKRLANCESLVRTLQNDARNETFIRFLRTSNQICGNAYSVICCPSPNGGLVSAPTVEIKQKILPTMTDGCGLKNYNGKVAHTQLVGGAAATPGAWPWIALIGYNDSVSGSTFKCGGTLITDRHVLTAAHCIRNDLSFIRLGEHDLSTDTDGDHIDVPVSKVLKHPQFSRTNGHNDIALLYLSENVQLNERIVPICLPTSAELLTKSFVDRSAYAAGWGRTVEGGKSATMLQELKITVYANKLCKDLYRKNNKLISEEQFDSAVVCAGDLAGGKDSCQGDSGGPLMVAERYNRTPRFVLIGVVSYGIGCARKETPGVYASVANFMEWIREAVDNNN